jgi:acetolactate synthase-1/2/3 large subunit
MTLPMVKHSYLVWDVNELPRIVKEAFHIASTGRPGPVLIDIPKNIQNLTTQPIFPKTVNLRGYKPERKADDVALNELIGMLGEAKAPMIYCGGGVISGEASAELLEFAERTQIPVATTLMGIGGFPETHPLSLKWLGMHGTVYANNAVNEADLLLAIGVPALTTASPARSRNYRARQNRSHRHRQFRDQQKQSRLSADPERSQIRPDSPEQTSRSGWL